MLMTLGVIKFNIQISINFISFDSIFAQAKTKPCRVRTLRRDTVERAMLDDRGVPMLPKNPSRDEAGSSTAKG